MQLKILCGCGTKYKFDVEPVNGRMPFRVQCPSCGADGTMDADLTLAKEFPSGSQPSAAPFPAPAAPAPPPTAAKPGLRLASSAGRESASAVAEPPATPAFGSGSDFGKSLLQRSTFFVKERVATLKLTDTYDIMDPVTSQPIGIAREEPPGWAKWLRLAVKKHMLPTAVNVYEAEGQPAVLSIRRGFTFLQSKVQVVSGDGRSLGYFKSKLFSIGGGFYVFDHADQQVAEVKGNWKGRNFKFLDRQGREIGTVAQKWAGLAKELFTSADKYVISLSDTKGAGPDAGALLLAAGLAIDIVFKENE